MDHYTTVRFSRPSSGEAIDVEGVFPDEEWQILRLFMECSDQLEETRIGREGAEVRWSTRWTKTSGLEYHVEKQPGDDELAVLLHRLRPFVLRKERSAVGRVCNVLARRLTHPVAREAIDRERDRFTGKSFQSQLTVSVNDLVMNSEGALFLWLNGFEYHRDQDKQAALQAIAPMMPLEFARAIFVDMMLEKAKAVRRLARLIRLLIGNERADSGRQRNES